MRFVIQRVAHASVTVDKQCIGKIEKGLLVLIGVADTDTKEIADKMIKKLLGLRIFEDEQGKTNLDIHTVDGALLLVSQFTLYAEITAKGVIAQALPGLASLIWQRRCINISLKPVKNRLKW